MCFAVPSHEEILGVESLCGGVERQQQHECYKTDLPKGNHFGLSHFRVTASEAAATSNPFLFYYPALDDDGVRRIL